MEKKNLTPLLALLLSKKIIIPVALLLAIAAVVASAVVIRFSLNMQLPRVEGISTVDIPASLNLDFEAINCMTTQESLTASVTKPSANSKFLTTDTIDFNASVEYLCEDNPEMVFAWRLDGNSEPFSTSKDTASLKNLKAGVHTVKYTASTADITSETQVKFTVAEPITYNIKCFDSCDSNRICQNGLSCQGGKCVLASNPTSRSCEPTKSVPPVQPTINQSPDSVQILSPKNGTTYEYASSYCSGRSANYPCIIFSGLGHDPEDGNLTGSKLIWYYEQGSCYTDSPDYGPKTQFGTGSNPTPFYASRYCGQYRITLRATDNNTFKETSVEVTIYNSPLG